MRGSSGRVRRHLTYPNVMSTLAVFLVLAGGTALAALPKNSVNSKTVRNGSLTSADLANRKGVKGVDVADGSLSGADLAAGSVSGVAVADGSLSGADLAPGSIGLAQLGPGAVGAEQLAPGSVTGPGVVDHGLTGADFGADSLTGRNVDESALGTVAEAMSLGGTFGTAFLPGLATVATTEREERGLALGDGTFKITQVCPPRSIVIGGGPVNLNPGTSLVESFPKDNTWTARINPHGQQDPFAVRVRCLVQTIILR